MDGLTDDSAVTTDIQTTTIYLQDKSTLIRTTPISYYNVMTRAYCLLDVMSATWAQLLTTLFVIPYCKFCIMQN